MQQINLYLDEFKKPKEPVTPGLMAQVMAATLALCVVVSCAFLVREWFAVRESINAQAEVERITEESRVLSSQLVERDQRAQFRQSIAQAEEQLTSSETVRAFLAQLQVDNFEGFSVFMKDLARARQQGLRLTQIEINEGGKELSLRGEAVASDLIPKFVKRLAQSESVLNKEQFDSGISKTDLDTFNFTLRSSAVRAR
mgnify:FL=1